MANKTRFRATGLSAIIGRLTIKHSTSSQNTSHRKITTFNTKAALQGKSNAGSSRSRKA